MKTTGEKEGVVMTRSKAAIVGMVLAFLVAMSLRPARAEADNTLLWVGIGVGAYAVLLVTATMLAFPHPAPLGPNLSELPSLDDENGRDTLRFGGGCAQNGPAFVVACW